MNRCVCRTPMLALLVWMVLPLGVEGQGADRYGPLSEYELSHTTWIEHFDVSPDGEQVVFKSARGGVYNLWRVSVSGGEPRQLTFYEAPYRGGSDVGPRWSPDGRWVAFEVDRSTTRQSGTTDIHVVGARGGQPRNLTNSLLSAEGNITWSPDGKHIAFTSNGLLGGGILKVDVDTGELTRISTRGGGGLQWSPDGRYLVYTSNRVRDEVWDQNNDIYLVDVGTGEERHLTPGLAGFKKQDPSWSPDGRRLVFTTDQSGYHNVAVLDLESGAVRILTARNVDHARPKWSPDGDRIAYVVNEEYHYYIETISPDGGEPQRVTTRSGVSGGMERIQLRGSLQ